MQARWRAFENEVTESNFTYLFIYPFIRIYRIILIPDEMESVSLIKASHFVNSIITLVSLVFIFKWLKQSDLLKLDKPELKFYFIALISGIGFVFFQSILTYFV